MPERQIVTLDGVEIELSRLDKPFWPEEGLTKAHLIAYYLEVAPYLLPHLKDRPLSLRRYPEGARDRGFFQKQAPDFVPPWVRRVPIAAEQRLIDFIVCDDLPTLVWLANLGCIDQNPWASRVPRLDQPDYVIFDLDPFPPAGLKESIRVALRLRELLDELGLVGYPKLSGATGFHVYLPIAEGYDFGIVRRFAGIIGRHLRQRAPELITMEWPVARRSGRVFFDHLMNTRGKTVASAYSVRPFPGAPVSAPLSWNEVHEELDPRAFSLHSMPGRLAGIGDLFAPVLGHGQHLEDAVQRLQAVVG